MDFGEILERWESEKREGGEGREDRDEYAEMMNRWLDGEKVPLKESDVRPRGRRSPSRKTVRRMAPQETLDLHGYTVDEALAELEAFLKRSRRRGIRKVLIIHGKGNHSESGESVLRSRVRSYIRSSSLCGEWGVSQPALGGEGAVWVVIR